MVVCSLSSHLSSAHAHAHAHENDTQVLTAILKNKSDTTRCSLVFGNVTVDDILLKEELDALAAKHADRLKVHYVLNTPPEGWRGGVGFITADVVRERLPAPGPDIMVMSCGPPPMVDALKKALDGLGYSEDAQFQF